jgi:hypothetical protein
VFDALAISENAAPTVVKDVYVHFVDRLLPYSRFATKYMNGQTSKHYMRCMRHIQEEVMSNVHAMICIQLILGQIKHAVLDLPLTKFSLRDRLNGEASSEIKARRLALEHAMDLVISYRRFDGLTPMSKQEEFLKWYAKDAMDALADNLASR